MTLALDVTAPAAPLARAAARISRLLPSRPAQPGHGALSLRADRDGLLLVATDGEVSVAVRVAATTHEPGEVTVSRRGLTETVAALDVPEIRLCAEGSRLAVRTPGARFALPRLGGAPLDPAGLPEAVGEVGGTALRAAAVPVAAAASREHALPIFTGVRLRSSGGRLSLLATDRYRLASASVAWLAQEGDGVELASLVPAAVLAEAARQAGATQSVAVHAGPELFGLAWDGGHVVTATLGAPFPDAQLDRLLAVSPECVVEVEAEALAAAVDRASRYAAPRGAVTVAVTDGALLVRASDPLTGESEEAVKAAVRGDHVTRFYQAGLLADALRPFAGQTVAMGIQPGMRATELSAAPGAPGAVDLRQLVVPMKPARTSDGAGRAG